MRCVPGVLLDEQRLGTVVPWQRRVIWKWLKQSLSEDVVNLGGFGGLGGVALWLISAAR